MAFISRREIWKGRGGSQDHDNNNESDRFFVVHMSASTDDELTVATGYGGPVLFDPHPTRNNCWVENVDIRNMDESAFLWLVHVHYSSHVFDPNQWVTSPLSKPPKDSWGHASYTLPAVEGYLFDPDTDVESSTKTAVTNSALDAFDPPEERNASRITIAVEVTAASPPSWILDYNDVLNSDSTVIRGITFPKYTLRINTRISELQIENGVTFRQIFYDIEARKETFLKRIPDRGYRDIQKKKLYDTNGGEPSQPLYLDAKGKALGRGLGTMTAGSHTLNMYAADSSAFTAADVGVAITVQGAGAAGDDLTTTISAFTSGTQVTLTAAASTGVTKYPVRWQATQKFRKYRVDEAKPFNILGLPG